MYHVKCMQYTAQENEDIPVVISFVWENNK
jgi:hypothetical protein